jgi:hypothetical protein
MMSDKKSQLVTNVPDYIKDWYKTTAESKGGRMQPFAAMVLCDYAITHGAVKPKADEKKKVTYNEFGEPVEH